MATWFAFLSKSCLQASTDTLYNENYWQIFLPQAAARLILMHSYLTLVLPPGHIFFLSQIQSSFNTIKTLQSSFSPDLVLILVQFQPYSPALIKFRYNFSPVLVHFKCSFTPIVAHFNQIQPQIKPSLSPVLAQIYSDVSPVVQCERGRRWCVDPDARELTGTRIHGSPDCGETQAP